MIVLVVVIYLLMTKTVFGRYLYAIGGNEEVARRQA
jgi:ribose/xylose/arabinose/galactoside ABC-type transport system permease subunit